ncbi:hypothetical protein TCAL_06919 [Tigriopus californicus]|uniref:Peptidase M3A/M3B catalytic domain-containing protein n=1 Tax=Tigriopus californicus TaxID=6832 RepID=A0A553NT20_TIGCA|nr:uncharacterized protein LOC131888716 [Tigriopus californicus]TRY68570.1 hypothetical protein TCAL_06919 [Tigriopus californicus]
MAMAHLWLGRVARSRLSVGVPLLRTAQRQASQNRVVLIPEIPPDDARTNPLLKPYSEGLPQFESVNERHCFFGLGKALLQFEANIGAIEDRINGGEVLDFEALFGAIDQAKCEYESVWYAVNLLHVTTEVLDRDIFMKLHRRAERALVVRMSSRGIHSQLKRLQQEDQKTQNLTPSQRHLLQRYLTEYKLKGFDLSENGYLELNETWLRRLAEAKQDYNYKMMMSTQNFRASVNDPQVVSDFPIDVLKAMALDSSQPTKGPWSVTLHPYLYQKFLEYCPDRRLRWNVYQASVSRGDRKQDVYNRVVAQVKEINQYRQDEAVTLGYPCFSELSMETKMAANVDNVKAMTTSLLGSAKSSQEMELESLQAYAESRGFDHDLTYYDIPYFKRKFRRTFLGLTDDDVRDFFPLPKVMNEVIKLCNSMFNIQIEEVKSGFQTWHPEVKFFRVIDADQKVLGHFYFDPYLRDDKGYPGADKGWFIPVRPHSIKANCQPLGALLMSLPVPGYGKPSLLNYDEVGELMRLFGNVLLHLLPKSEWSDLSGKFGLEWDALELASNFMGHWSEQPEIVSKLSGHWSSNEPISSDLAVKLCKSKQHMAGLELCQELYKTSVDMAFHDSECLSESGPEIANRLYDQYLLIPRIPEDTFPLNFAEIMGGEHAAAYFCRTWSKMLAADAFSAVKEAGLDNEEEVKKVAMRFRNTFLSMGSSLPMADIFRQFRGRDPSHEALLVSLGLKEIHKPKKRGSQEIAAN